MSQGYLASQIKHVVLHIWMCPVRLSLSDLQSSDSRGMTQTKGLCQDNVNIWDLNQQRLPDFPNHQQQQVTHPESRRAGMSFIWSWFLPSLPPAFLFPSYVKEVGRPVGPLVVCLSCWSVGWLDCCLTGWFVGQSADFLLDVSWNYSRDRSLMCINKDLLKSNKSLSLVLH